jgi:hypothetical protein
MTELPSRLYRIDRDMGEIAWVEEKDTALDDVDRAIRMGVLVLIEAEVWVGQDGGEYVVYDGAGQPVSVVMPVEGTLPL